MTSLDTPRATTIATGEPRFLAIMGTLGVCGLAASWVKDGPHWVEHAPRAAIAIYLAILAVALVCGCVRGWRIALRLDHDGVTVRNFFRTHRVAFAEVSCFADGSAFGGESQHWWALSVVLHDGRAITARGTTRSGHPRPKTLAAITAAAERYQIPAELTGAVSNRGLPRTRGLYADPGGQAGARYWNGEGWSPLLPADLANGKPLPEFPVQVSLPLPEPDGSWQYAALRAKRATVMFAFSAAATVLLLARALTVDLWDHGNHHKHYSPGGWLAGAGMCAYFGLAIWLARKRYRKLDKAANPAAGLPGVGDLAAETAPVPLAVTSGFPLPADVIYAGPSPRRRRIIPLTAAGASVVAAVAVTSIVLGSSPAHKPAATRARASTPAHTPVSWPLTIYQLRAGDCLQGPPDVNTVRSWPAEVTAVPCSEDHLAEVYFFSANYWPKAMTFPGHATIVRQARAECRKVFRAYDGIPVSGSEFSFDDISPWNRAYWHSGDRLLLCTTYWWTNWYPGGQPMNGSIKGSAS